MWVAPDLSGALLLGLLNRYLAAVSDEVGWLALALAFFLLARSTWRRPFLEVGPWRVATAAIAALSLTWALHLGWVADDAFISFRYARNWVEGAGLVFNPGERVEGYTNFLWVVLLSPFEAMGIPLPQVSVALTSICLALTLLLTASLSHRLWQQARGTTETQRHFPIASALLGLNYVFASFGTSGLETMLGTLLVLLALDQAGRGAFLASGTFAILATLAHPDHAIFYVCLAATLLLPVIRWRELAWFALPFGAIYVPYFAWRWSYYGDLFPNTYYAKNAYLSYFSQGARYIALSGMSGGLWAALPLSIYGMLRFRQLRLVRFCALALPLFLLYVAKIGGDFMLGRLICPLLPLVYITAELGLRSLVEQQRLRWATPAFALFCTAIVPVRFIKHRENYAHVADERTFYPVASYAPFALDNAYWHWAHAFNRTFRDLSRKPALAMFSVGIVGYETRLPLVDNAGLNHRELAHWRSKYRGRPGHEKLISPAMLVRSAADLSDVAVYPEPYLGLGQVNVDGVGFHAVKYDGRLFDELALAGVRPPALLSYIDEYEPAAAPERLACDLWHMEQLYFRHESAPTRRAALLEKLLAARPEWREYQAFLLSHQQPTDAEWAAVASLQFEQRDEQAQLSGTAFLNNPAAREGVGQRALAGTLGRFINTFQDEDGNQATGTYTSSSFRIEGELMTLQVGGGHFPDGEYVELLVGGERQFHATGCDSGITGRRLWITRGLRGQLAQLRIVDRLRRELGHIVVDELVQWEKRGQPVATPPSGQPLEAGHSVQGLSY